MNEAVDCVESLTCDNDIRVRKEKVIAVQFRTVNQCLIYSIAIISRPMFGFVGWNGHNKIEFSFFELFKI